MELGTRTAWEDWDDGPNSDISLEWTNKVEMPYIDKLFFLEGQFMMEGLKYTGLELKLWNSIPAINLSVFKISGFDSYLCLAKDYDLVKSNEVIELLEDWILKCTNVIVFQCKPLSEYQVLSQRDQHFVARTIATTKSIKNVTFPKVEQPNIISGVGAGIISIREHLELPAIAIVCYVQCLEDYDVKLLQELFSDFKIKPKVRVEPMNILNTNLYT